MVAVLGAILFFRLEGFFRSSTDVALKYRLALELRNLEAPISPELEAAEQDFLNRSLTEGKLPTPTEGLEFEDELEDLEFLSVTPTLTQTAWPIYQITPTRRPAQSTEIEHEGKSTDEVEENPNPNLKEVPPTRIAPLLSSAYQSKSVLAKPRTAQVSTPTPTPALVDSLVLAAQTKPVIDNAFDSELSAIFVSYIDASGGVIPTTFSNSSPFKPDIAAILAAKKSGIDLRTVAMADGTPVRYLTYMLPDGYPAGFIQLGRKIDDQVRLLNEYLMSMLMIGLVFLVLLGIGSWWIAGRAVIPTQRSLDQQQSFIANASHEFKDSPDIDPGEYRTRHPHHSTRGSEEVDG